MKWQKKLKSRQRPGQTNEISLFAGLIKCGECGKSLTIRYTNAKHPQRIYSCKTYNAFVQNLNPFLVPCEGAFHCFPLFPLLGFTGIGQAVGNRFPVHQGSSGTFPDFQQHMAAKGVIVNPVLGAVVLSKGIVGFAGVNLLGMFCCVPVRSF